MINYLKNDSSKTDTTETLSLFKPKEKTYVKEHGELHPTSLLYVADGKPVNNEDLTKEMVAEENANLYYKIITDLDGYSKYQSALDLPELTEQEFQNYFVIVIYNEKERDLDETDLYISKVYFEDATTHIVLKQKDNASSFALNNVFYGIIEKSQLKDHLVIEVDK